MACCMHDDGGENSGTDDIDATRWLIDVPAFVIILTSTSAPMHPCVHSLSALNTNLCE